jgi:hypothetical protein
MLMMFMNICISLRLDYLVKKVKIKYKDLRLKAIKLM